MVRKWAILEGWRGARDGISPVGRSAEWKSGYALWHRQQIREKIRKGEITHYRSDLAVHFKTKTGQLSQQQSLSKREIEQLIKEREYD